MLELDQPPIVLLDVNLLIALVDSQHVHHDPAHHWFSRHALSGWATCPLTQNVVLRILGNPRYPNSPGSPATVMPLLAGLLAHSAHVFWPDDLSWDSSNHFRGDQLLSHGQVTDTYLLALALHHRGVLVTLDKRLSAAAVPAGSAAIELILPNS